MQQLYSLSNFVYYIIFIVFCYVAIKILEHILPLIKDYTKSNKDKYLEKSNKLIYEIDEEIKEVSTVEYFCREMKKVLNKIIQAYDSDLDDFTEIYLDLYSIIDFFIECQSVDEIAQRRKLYYEDSIENNTMTFLYNDFELEITTFQSVFNYLNIYDGEDEVLLYESGDLVEKYKYEDAKKYFHSIEKRCVQEKKDFYNSLENKIEALKQQFPH